MIVLVRVLQRACLIARLQQQGMSVVEVQSPTARPSAPEKKQQSLTYTKAKA